jgi:hypothetical protein
MAPVNKAEKLDDLVGSVEELLAHLPESLGPAITALRDRVDDGIFEAWTAISSERAIAERLAVKATTRGAPLRIAAFLGVAILLAHTARLLAHRHIQPARRRLH